MNRELDIDWRGVAIALAMIIASVGAIVCVALFDIQLTLRRSEVPPMVVYGIGAFLTICGGIGLLFSISHEIVCQQCGQGATRTWISFHPEHQKDLVDAVSEEHFDRLAELARHHDADGSIDLSLYQCRDCETSAVEIEQGRRTLHGPEELHRIETATLRDLLERACRGFK